MDKDCECKEKKRWGLGATLLKITETKATQNTKIVEKSQHQQSKCVHKYGILEIEDDRLMRNLFELKASNQDKLYPTMIKNILSKRTWNHYQGSPQVTCKDSRKTLAVCPKSLCLALRPVSLRPVSLTTWEGLRGRTSKNKETTWRTSQFPGQTEGSEGFGGPEQETDIK